MEAVVGREIFSPVFPQSVGLIFLRRRVVSLCSVSLLAIDLLLDLCTPLPHFVGISSGVHLVQPVWFGVCGFVCH